MIGFLSHHSSSLSTLYAPSTRPPLHPLLPLVSVTVLIAQWWRLRPYMYQTPKVHHPTAIVEIPDVTTNPTSLLIPVNPVATTRLSIAHIHPIEGITAAIVIFGDGLVVSRQNLCINCINFTSVRG